MPVDGTIKEHSEIVYIIQRMRKKLRYDAWLEGAEMDVLCGMKETILQHKPKLAVCIYHKHEDIFRIASYLLELVPEYKFYIRHYNSNETETVLFCKI